MKQLALACALVLVVDTATASVDTDPVGACTLSGKVSLSTTVYSAATSGSALAVLNWTERRIDVTSLPSDSLVGRAHVDARREKPSMRVVGWMPAESLPFATKADVVVVPDHVWIRGGAALRVLQPKAGDLEIEPRFPTFGKLRAGVGCGDLKLGTDSPKAGPTGPSKTYRFKSKSTKLYDAAGGKQVFTLELLGATNTLDLEIRETKGAWHHLQWASNETVDGWLRAQDLVPVKDDDEGVFGALGGLGLSGSGKSVATAAMIAGRDTSVFLDTAKSALVAGVLEKGAKVRATPSAPGFSAITLWDHDVSAPAGKEFHVATADLQSAP